MLLNTFFQSIYLIHSCSYFCVIGAIPWFIVAELFTQSSISAAVSIAGPTNWFGNFAVGLLFPVMKVNN